MSLVPPYRDATSMPQFLFLQAAAKPEVPFLWAKSGSDWVSTTWGEAADKVRACAAGLEALGVQAGDRVMLVSENRPEWVIADYGIMTAGAITVPAYVTNTVGDHQHILTDSRPAAVIVSKPNLARKVLEALLREDIHIPLIAIEPFDAGQVSITEIISWSRMLAAAPKDLPQPGPSSRDDIACIIYTSGTGGTPKGVLLTHEALISNCEGAWHHWNNLLPRTGAARFLSFLPLSHSYEHTCGMNFPITVGAEIYYAEGVNKLTQDMLTAHPTLMIAVPRLYDMMRTKIMTGIAKQNALRRAMFKTALRLGLRRLDGEAFTEVEETTDRILDRTVRRHVRDRFGGCLRAMISGGAPLNPEIGRFFTAMGIQILQGYGQTESAPVISSNRVPGAKIHTVGPAFFNVEVRLAADGELLVKAPSLMKGYWNRPKETAAAIDADGWLHTGDVCAIDEDGHILITDRKKDIIVNSGGDNVSPQRVEGMLTLAPEIAQALVYGDKRPHLVAVLVPDETFAQEFAEKAGKAADPAALVADPDFQKAMRAAVSRVNSGLSTVEKVRGFILTAEPFSVENDMMTATSKIRRHVIHKAYGDRLNALYD